jgi:hypothetical protein
MKKLLTISIIALFFLTSCEKEHEKDEPCPLISADKVPVPVISSFTKQYPGLEAKTWYYHNGYAAFFLNNNVKTLAYFDDKGVFIKEKVKAAKGNGDGEGDDDCEYEDD